MKGDLAASIRSLTWTDVLIYVLTEPSAVFRYVTERENFPFKASFAVPAAAALAGVLAPFLISNNSGFPGISYGWIFQFIILSVYCTGASALMDMAAQFYGCQGRVRAMLTVLNLSLFPEIFLLPGVFIFSILDFAPVFFFVVIQLALFVWSSVILVINVSGLYGIGQGKAFMICVFPVILYIVYISISSAIFLTGIFSSLMKAF